MDYLDLHVKTQAHFTDQRREQLKTKIMQQQDQFRTYSSMGAAATTEAARWNTAGSDVQDGADRSYPEISVEAVLQKSTEKMPSTGSQGQAAVKLKEPVASRQKALLFNGRFNDKKKTVREMKEVGARKVSQHILVGSKSQRLGERTNQVDTYGTRRSMKRLRQLKGGSLWARKALQPKRQSLQQIIASNPNLKIIQIASGDSSDSSVNGEKAEAKTEGPKLDHSKAKGPDTAAILKKAEDRERRLQERRQVMEVRNLLHRSVYPEGHDDLLQGRSRREIEKQFRSIYKHNELQPSQLPLPRVHPGDFYSLQQNIGAGGGYRARPDSLKLTIRSQIYKGNQQISSRGQNLINLVSPLRKRTGGSARPQTAMSGVEDTSDIDTRKEESQAQLDSRPTSQRRDRAGAPMFAWQRPKQADDSYEVYTNEVQKRYETKDAKTYIKRVLLEDIVYHKITGQEERIHKMHGNTEGEYSKLVRRLSKRTSKPNHPISATTLRDTSYGPSGPSKSNEDNQGSKSRPESRPANEYSDLSKSKGFQSESRSRSFVPSRPPHSPHGGTSAGGILQDGSTSQAEIGDYGGRAGFLPSGQQSRAASATKGARKDRVGMLSKGERNASARLINEHNGSQLARHGYKKQASSQMRQNQTTSSPHVSQEGGPAKVQTQGKANYLVDATRNTLSGRNSRSFKNASASQVSSLGGQVAPRSHRDQTGNSSTPQRKNQSSEKHIGLSSKSNNPSQELDEPFPEKDNDRPLPLSEEQKQVIRLIQLPPAAKTEKNIDFLYSYFNKFDFLQAQKKEQESKSKFNSAAKQTQQKKAQEMAKDQKSIEQMCRVTKYLFAEKGNTVFDYNSQGDLFYMVISGRVLCKIPFFKQLVLLSQAEKELFQLQFKEDVLGIQEAVELNKERQLYSENASAHSGQKEAKPKKPVASKKLTDLSKLQHLKNPYDLEPRQLLRYSREELARTHATIANRKRKELEERARQEVDLKESANDQESERSSSLPEQPEQEDLGQSLNSDLSSAGESEKNRRASEQQRQLKDPEYLASIDPEYKALKEAFQNLLDDPNSQVNRKYYQLNIMKLVKTYHEHGSFGELALITNKRRKAKLETSADTHFAVLSKEDYRQAQYKAQNQRLKDKIAFLRNFDLFSMVSESQLSVLSYRMKEEMYYRDQVVYREGLDPVDKIYLIKHGDFLLSKQLIRKVETYSAAQVLKDAQSEDLNGSVETDTQSSGLVQPQLFSYKQFKNLQSMRTYATTSRQSKANEIQICILGDRDAFGYQELLEHDVEHRSCTVRCLKNESPVVTIDKHALIPIVRGNPRILEQMKAKWTQFLVDRVSNKLFVEQILQQSQEEQGKDSSAKKQQQKEKELQSVFSSIKLQEEGAFNLDPQKAIEDNIRKQNRSLLMLPQGQGEFVSVSSSSPGLLGERLQLPRTRSSIQYKSKAGNQMFSTPRDGLMLQEYADAFQDRFWVDTSQSQSHGANSARDLPKPKKEFALDRGSDETANRYARRGPRGPAAHPAQPYSIDVNLPHGGRDAHRPAQFGSVETQAWSTLVHRPQQHGPGRAAIPYRGPVLLPASSGRSSLKPQIIRSHSTGSGAQSGSATPAQALIVSEGTQGGVANDMTFHKLSAQHVHTGTPATVIDLVDVAQARQATNPEMIGTSGFGSKEQQAVNIRLYSEGSQQPLTEQNDTERNGGTPIQESVPPSFGPGQQHRRGSHDLHRGSQAMALAPDSVHQPPHPPALAQNQDHFANWNNLLVKGTHSRATRQPPGDRK